MYKKILTSIALLFIAFMSACASTSEETPLVDLSIIENVTETFPVLDSTKFGEPQTFDTEDEILSLSSEQKKNYQNFVDQLENRSKRRHQVLYEYLQEFGEKFEYELVTSSAQSTLNEAKGNCMSLAVLTTALAKASDIEIKYQLVNRIPIYQEYGSVVFNAQHIRSIIYEPQQSMTPGTVSLSAWRSKAVIDYYPSQSSFVSGSVSQSEFLAMYYRNLASEAIGVDDNNKAYWLLKRSLEVEPENAQTINSLAVLHRRVGEYAKAEALYKYGIKQASNKVSLLRNYKVLLLEQERFADADRVAKELDNLEDLNPFNWMHVAKEAYEENDYELSAKLYRKAIELAPYLHQAHFGLAKAEYQRGNYHLAQKSLETAQEEAFDNKSKSIYEAKLAVLSKERFN